MKLKKLRSLSTLALWCKPFLSYVEKHRGRSEAYSGMRGGYWGSGPPLGQRNLWFLRIFLGYKIPEYAPEGMTSPPTGIGLNCKHV